MKKRSLKIFDILIFFLVLLNFSLYEYLTLQFGFYSNINIKFLTFWYFVGIVIMIFVIYLIYVSYLKEALILGLSGTSLLIFTNISIIFLFDPSLILSPYHPIPILTISEVIIYLISLLILLILLNILILLYFLYNNSPKAKEEALIRKSILESGTNFTRTGIKEISEKLGIDLTSIIFTVKKMINNEDVNAVYFNSTKSIAYNQQLNISKHDEFMRKYSQWEKNNIAKLK